MELQHLTQMHSVEADRQHCETPDGMAFWAETGPRGTTCRQCEHWGLLRPHYDAEADRVVLRRQKVRRDAETGRLKPRRCAEYKRQMMGRVGGLIQHNVSACKYFAAGDGAPPIKRPDRKKKGALS